jgi:hypothetical protein
VSAESTSTPKARSLSVVSYTHLRTIVPLRCHRIRSPGLQAGTILFLLKASFFVCLVRRLVNSLLPSVRARIEDQGIYVGGKKKAKRSSIVALETARKKLMSVAPSRS